MKKIIEYLSPSSYMKSKSMPYSFYLQRLHPDVKLPYDPQSLPAGDGSAFDYYIKKKMVAELFPEKKEFMSELIKSVEPHNKEECFPRGQEIFGAYVGECYNKEDWADVEIWDTWMYKGIPIRVKLDASVWRTYPIKGDPLAVDFESDNLSIVNKQIPFDWKVSGSRSQASPKKGFFSKLTKKGWQPPHKDWYPEIEFKEIDEKWANQMAIYGWKLGWSKNEWEEYHARLHMLAFSKTRALTIAFYEGRITPQFQEDLFNDMKYTWDSFKNGNFIKDNIKYTDSNSAYIKARSETWF